ncbi:MAG: hypothetical protein HIU85_07795 [Proteobacteria bacterium]|nr:hypothetical protein [Pseudomonadota bacterium]
MRNQSSSSKNVIAALVAAAFGLTAGPALAQTSQTHRMKEAQARELRVASAEHGVRNTERTMRSGAHPRSAHPANSHPPR